jgi:hypothetical protein
MATPPSAANPTQPNQTVGSFQLGSRCDWPLRTPDGPYPPLMARGLFSPLSQGQRRNAETPSTCWSSMARACGQYRIGLGHWECPYEPDYRSGLVVEKEPAVGSSPCTIRGPRLVKFVTRVFIAVPRHPATRAMLYTNRARWWRGDGLRYDDCAPPPWRKGY